MINIKKKLIVLNSSALGRFPVSKQMKLCLVLKQRYPQSIYLQIIYVGPLNVAYP